MSLTKYFILLTFFILPINNLFAWQNKLDVTIELSLQNIAQGKFEANESIVPKIKSPGVRNKILILNRLLYYEREKEKDYFFYELNILDKENKVEIVLEKLILGYLELFYNTETPTSFEYFYEAYSSSKKQKELQKLSLAAILRLYSNGILQNTKNYVKYLTEYKELLEFPDDYINFYYLSVKLYGTNNLYGTGLEASSIDYSKQLDSLKNLFTDEDPSITKLNYTKGTFFFIKEDYDNAHKEFLKIIDHSNHTPYQKPILFNTYLKLAHIHLGTDLSKTLFYLNEVETAYSQRMTMKNRFALTWYKAEYYERTKDSAKAYQYLKETNSLRYQLNFLKSNEQITESEIENRTKEKEFENLELKRRNKQQFIMSVVAIAILLLVSITSYLAFTNSRKKRLITLKEKELEKQKNLTLLKEQEITTINAMVEGQEKERKRVAEDLHDNLGSVIATLKLHFDNLRMNKEKKKIDQEILFDKTENLIDEAYQKVRSIAHAKNSGVIANQGLLVAVKLMAEKISSANGLQIEVIDYGLEKPIENALEIALFRIIQELTTNIIKHAKASMATINISQDTDDITILIEDNGVGMNTSQINIQKGMGLHSIKTRVEHLEGSFTVDSTPSKGTTIIINIPS